MFIKLLIAVLYTFVSIFTSILLLRFYCLLIKLNLKWIGGNFGSFVYKVSDWIVLPVRKYISIWGSLDFSILICAYLIFLVFNLIQVELIFGKLIFTNVLILSLFDLLEACISGLIAITFISVLLSWISANDRFNNLFVSLVNPILWPVRKFTPLIAGLDLSPFITLLLLQALNFIIRESKYQLMI